MIGFHQLVSSRSPKIYGVNVYKLFSIIYFAICFIFAPIMILLSLYYSYKGDNFNQSIHILTILLSAILGNIKMFCLWTNLDRIWSCIQLTSTKHLSYKYHSTEIMDAGRNMAESFSLFFIGLWIISIGTWVVSPLLVNNYFLHIYIGNKMYNYRYNLMNFIYPATDVFYNDHFKANYFFEFSAIFCGVHGSLIFDIIIISLCVIIRYQLKVLSNSYSTMTDSHNNVSTRT